MFRDRDAAKAWIAESRWPDGKAKCPHCGTENVQSNIKHKTMTHRCRQCVSKPMFSLNTGTVMEGSNLKYRAWAVAIYLFTTNLRGISSMKLHRELGIRQKAAWFMLHRLRLAFEADAGPFEGRERPWQQRTALGRSEQRRVCAVDRRQPDSGLSVDSGRSCTAGCAARSQPDSLEDYGIAAPQAISGGVQGRGCVGFHRRHSKRQQSIQGVRRLSDSEAVGSAGTDHTGQFERWRCPAGPLLRLRNCAGIRRNAASPVDRHRPVGPGRQSGPVETRTGRRHRGAASGRAVAGRSPSKRHPEADRRRETAAVQDAPPYALGQAGRKLRWVQAPFPVSQPDGGSHHPEITWRNGPPRQPPAALRLL